MKSMVSLCVLWVSLVAAQGQEPPGTVSGRVVDPSGAAVPDATIRVTESGTRKTAATHTDGQGRYMLSSLRPGSYHLSAEAAGFDVYERDGLSLRAGQTIIVDVTLQIHALSTSLIVREKASALESATETHADNIHETLEMWEAKESSAKDLGEALARLAGLWKIRKGGIANDITLRGFQQENLNVLVDGVRIYGACPNNMDPPAFHVDFAEIQQVELTKGAFNVRDQGSLGGTVNIVRKPAPPGLVFSPNFSTSSFGYYNPSLSASLSKGKLQGLAGYALRRSNPFRDGRGKPFTAYANYRDSTRGATAFDIHTAWFRFGIAPREGHRWELEYSRQQGGQVLYPYLLMDGVYDHADRLSTRYEITRPTNLVTFLRVQGYFTRVNHFMTDELRLGSVGASRPYGMATQAETQVLGARVEAQLSDFNVGFEGYRRGWNAETTLRLAGLYSNQPSLPDVVTSVGGFYGEYGRIFFNKLSIHTGARLDTSRSEAREPFLNTDLFWAYKGTRARSKSDTTPSGSLRLTYDTGKGFEVFAGLGHTTRLPDPQERFFALKRMGTDWVGNPGLQPTRNTEVDVGISYRGRRFSLRPTLFYSHLTDFIVVHNQRRINSVEGVMNSTARSYENVAARIYGGELSYSVGLTRAILFLGGLSYVRGSKEPRPAYGILDRNLAEMPPFKSRTALRWGTKVFFAEGELALVRGQGMVDLDLQEDKTPGYARMNFRTGIHARKLNLTVGIENLFNRFYYEHLSFQRDPFRSGVKVPEPGRGFYLNVSYTFQKSDQP